MRILFITQFFWPEVRTAPTNLGFLAEDLAKNGHDVLVVTGVPNHPLGKIYDNYKMKLWQWEVTRGFKILRLPLIPNHSQSILWRGLNYASFTLSAMTLGIGLTLGFNADVIFAYYAPLNIGGIVKMLKIFHKVPVVYWVTDLWPENFSASGINISRRVYAFLRRFEDFGYRQSSMICVDSPGYKKNLLRKGVPAKKIRVVAEWADETLFFPVEKDETIGRKFGLTDKFNIMYGGNLGDVQKLETVIESAILVSDLTDIQIVFIGDGNAEKVISLLQSF